MKFKYSTDRRKVGAQYAESEQEMLDRHGANGWLLVAVRDDVRRGEQSDHVYYFVTEVP